MISFDVNDQAKKSLSTKKYSPTPILFAFNARSGSTVESCGANCSDVIGGVVDPTMADSYDSWIKTISELGKYTSKQLENIKQQATKQVFSHPMVEAAHLAFSEHYPLVISPDDVWLCIAQGFANHVNQNAEALRDRFVQHQDQTLIEIQRDSFVKGEFSNDWQGCFSEFSDQLAGYLGKKRDLVVANFSTTSVIEKAVSEVILMDSMKSYFKYGVTTLCGIPSITLTGTVEDWENILLRTQALSEFDLKWWIDVLQPVLQQIIETAKGNPDIKFWDSYYKKIGMSGGPFVSGWINYLFPYINAGKKGMIKNTGSYITLNSYPNGLSKVEFEWKYFDTKFPMEFLGGMVGVNQDSTTLALRPVIGWAVKDK